MVGALLVSDERCMDRILEGGERCSGFLSVLAFFQWSAPNLSLLCSLLNVN